MYLKFQKPDTDLTPNAISIINDEIMNQNNEQISLDEFRKELLNEDIILIDVRSAEEQDIY